MKRVKLFGVGGLIVVALAGYAETVNFRAHAQNMVGIVAPASVSLRPSPIRAEWVLEGQPVTMAQEIAHTDDGSTKVFVWQTTAGRFNWFYDSDEVVSIIDGEVFVTDASKVERRLGPGDVAFFPQGAATTWRVPDHVRKIAMLKRTLPGPVASVMRWVRMAKSWLQPESAFAAD